MEKFDYRKVLVSGNEYECARTKNGRIHLFYVENGIKHMFSFDDTMHVDFLSKVSYFVTHERMILEVKSIDFINYETGYTFFTGRVKFDEVISTESQDVTDGTHREEEKMKLTKYEMVLEILDATEYITTITFTESILKRVDTINTDYIKRVYSAFLTDKEHADFYLALITR